MGDLQDTFVARHRGQIAEVINRNNLVSRFLTAGYNVFLPVFDAGIDFILHRESDKRLMKVQLKSRWTIQKKYLDRDLWIAFPDSGSWYLMPHEDMVRLGDELGFTRSKSWTEEGGYSVKALSRQMALACREFLLPDELSPPGSD